MFFKEASLKNHFLGMLHLGLLPELNMTHPDIVSVFLDSMTYSTSFSIIWFVFSNKICFFLICLYFWQRCLLQKSRFSATYLWIYGHFENKCFSKCSQVILQNFVCRDSRSLTVSSFMLLKSMRRFHNKCFLLKICIHII